MGQWRVQIAALQWAAMHDGLGAEDTVTSPYLDHVRSTREIVEQLIAAREIELVKTSEAAQQQRIRRDLAFLHDELPRLCSEAEGISQCGSFKQDQSPPR